MRPRHAKMRGFKPPRTCTTVRPEASKASAGLRYLSPNGFAFTGATSPKRNPIMDVEHINAIGNSLADLTKRTVDLRGYL
jgi:hypothetical protein